MMKKLIFSLLLACVTFTHAASKMPPNLPLEVRKELAEAISVCRETSIDIGYGRGEVDFRKAVSIVDLNGDGLPDYIVEHIKFECDAGASIYAGNGPGTLSIYAGLPNGYARLAFLDAGYESSYIDRTSGKPRFYVSTSGGGCGQDTRHVTKAELEFCYRPIKWNAAKRRFEFDSLSTIRKHNPRY